jgi:hypothetical protein
MWFCLKCIHHQPILFPVFQRSAADMPRSETLVCGLATVQHEKVLTFYIYLFGQLFPPFQQT